MFIFIRFILISLFATVSLVIFFLILAYYLGSRSIPNYEQTFFSNQINKKIEIYRDSYAIPYINTSNENDAFFGLGYVHAQDRLWQMTILRKMAQGRLSEVFGQDALNSDLLFRSIDIYGIALKAERKQNSQTLSFLQSYSDGINKRLKEISDEGLGRGSPEFFLYSPQISPWRPADSIALLKLLGFQMSKKAFEEVIHTMLSLKNLPENRINELIYNNLNTNKRLINNKKTNLKNNNFLFIEKMKDININDLPRGGASNIFAVAPQKSATTNSLSAVDLHFPLTIPSKFYLAKINFEEGPVIGASIPGIPAIIVGRNKYISWGISSSYVDDQDLFLEKNNPNNNQEFLSYNNFKKYKTRKEIVNIKNMKGKTFNFKSSDNGPILVGNQFGVENIKPNGYEFGLKWLGLLENDRSIETFISIMKSKNFFQAQKKLNNFITPSLNLLLADKKNIGIFTIGKIPKRDLLHETQGKTPSLGWKKNNKWIENLNFQNNPKIVNPKQNFVVNTNNMISSKNFPFHYSFNFGDTQRIIRASNLLKKNNLHTSESFTQIQTDSISISARILLPLIAKKLWFKDNDSSKFDKTVSKSLEILANWNGDMLPNEPEPLIYAAWINSLQKNIIQDEIEEIYYFFKDINPYFLEKVFSNIDEASIWCDIKQTQEKESCEFISKKSLNEAIENLKSLYGHNIDNWRWGDAHKIVHKSKVFGNFPILSFFSNIVQEIPGGDNTLMLSKNSNDINFPYYSSFGSVLRSVFELSEDNNSLFILSTGQSEHFLSKHYDDQSLLWKQNRYLNLYLDENEKLKGSIRKTIIEVMN